MSTTHNSDNLRLADLGKSSVELMKELTLLDVGCDGYYTNRIRIFLICFITLILEYFVVVFPYSVVDFSALLQ